MRGDDVNWTDRAFSIVTLIPVFKSLKIVDKVGPALARAFRIGSRNPQAMVWMGRTLRDMTKTVFTQRRFDQFIMLAPFILVAAQLAEDEEVLEFFLATINSTDDVMALIELFNFPEDGWDGDESPEVEVGLGTLASHDGYERGLMVSGGQMLAFERTVPDWREQAADQVLGLVVPRAHAAGGKAAGVVASRLITQGRKVLNVLPSPVLAQLKKGKGALRALVNGAKESGSKTIRKSATSMTQLASAKVIASVSGAKLVKNLMKGFKNNRVGVPLLMASVLYLESEAGNGNMPEQVIKRIRKKLGEIAIDAAKDGKLKEEDLDGIAKEEDIDPGAGPGSLPSLRGKGHGEVFHIVMTAYYQAMSHVPGQRPLKGIEKVRSVWLFDPSVRDIDNAITAGKTLARFVRRADIVLGNPADPNSNEFWVELKSYKARDSQKYIPTAGLPDVWRMQKNSRDKKSALHRQFVLDRVAAEGPAEGAIATRKDWSGSSPDNLGRRVEIDDFQWWFQSFNRRVDGRREVAVDIGSNTNRNSILGVFSQSPEGEAAVVAYNLGVRNAKASYPLAREKVGMAKAKALLIKAIKDSGQSSWVDMFEQILDEVGITE